MLYKIVQKFSNFELHPDKISNHEMGLVFEELIRRFAEASNETAGEHFTPRDVLRLTTSLLFSKMHSASDGGGRVGIILNGSPLFTGGVGSGESEIRRYILENDLLETIVALPTDMFFNTGIATYVWILSNKKDEDRKNKVQLIDATDMGEPMRKSLGNKRKQLYS